MEQIKVIGQDATLRQEVLDQARRQEEARAADLETEQRGLEKDLARWHQEVRDLTGQIRPGEDNGSLIARLADLQERIGRVDHRVRGVRQQIQIIYHQLIGEDEAATALSVFDPVWESLTPSEQARVIGLLVERVDYDGSKGKVCIAFRPTGIKPLPENWPQDERPAATKPTELQLTFTMSKGAR